MKKQLLKLLGVRVQGLSEEAMESNARVIERAANTLEAHGHDALGASLRATGLQLIDVASRPYNATPVASPDGPGEPGAW